MIQVDDNSLRIKFQKKKKHARRLDINFIVTSEKIWAHVIFYLWTECKRDFRLLTHKKYHFINNFMTEMK